MSKVDAQRAMREARYAAEHAAAAGRRTSPAAATAATAVAAGDDAGLCGHRSMNNRTCRRPAGHAEKNHRYS